MRWREDSEMAGRRLVRKTQRVNLIPLLVTSFRDGNPFVALISFLIFVSIPFSRLEAS
jgi:hypothetical protein